MSWGEYDKKAEGSAFISGLAMATRAMGLVNRFGAPVVEPGSPKKRTKVRLGSEKKPHGKHRNAMKGVKGGVRFWEQSELDKMYGHEDSHRF